MCRSELKRTEVCRTNSLPTTIKNLESYIQQVKTVFRNADFSKEGMSRNKMPQIRSKLVQTNSEPV